ncbi:hypothetical protein N0V85_007762 [Neurospora sp. IMI 360204]|nr:hypothetical protein N0V85_007762 [Neurospora sp. IMI 360204]
MDPISFTVSLIAVVGLAGEVVKTCKTFIDGITDYPREFRLIYIEVNSVKAILDGLTLLREDDYEDAIILRSIRGSEVQSIKAKLDRAEQDRMHAWLVQVNPSSNHNAAKSLYEEGTCDWIFRSQEWNLWVNKQSEKRSLWIHGIPGAGKTILASHIMDELIKTKCSGNVVLVYYYCYHSHNRDETFPFLRWLVSQLCRNTDTVSSLTYEIYRSGQDPDVPKLLTALHAQLDGLDTVYVAVDALDESQKPRETFLGVLHTLATDPRFQMIQLLTTSREYADIERVMAPISFSVPTSHEEVEKDIRVFVDRSMSQSDDFKRWPDDLKLEVVDALAKGAKGMFRWAVCQLDILRRLNCATYEDVRQTIKTLPKDWDETYMRILSLIHPDDLELVRFTIHWIIYTEDLFESYDWILDVSKVLSYYVLHRYGSSVQANQISIPCNFERLKESCGCLVSFVGDQQDEENHICKLSHYTIKEFLQSSRFKPTGQLICLDLATMKTYLPNVILQMTIDRDGCDAQGRKDLYGFFDFATKVLLAEEFLDHKLVFSAFLIDIPPNVRFSFINRRLQAMWDLYEIESHMDMEDEVRAKVVQKLHDMGAVSMDEETKLDLQPDYEKDVGPKAEPTLESGGESHEP